MQEEAAKWSEEEEVPSPARKQATLEGRRQKPNTQPPPRAGARPGPGPRGSLGPHPGAQDALRGGPPGGSARSKQETTERRDGGPRAGSAGRGSATGQVRTSGRGPGPTRTYVGQNCSADRRDGAGDWVGGDGHGRRGAAEVAAAPRTAGAGRASPPVAAPLAAAGPSRSFCCCAALGTADRPLRPAVRPAPGPRQSRPHQSAARGPRGRPARGCH